MINLKVKQLLSFGSVNVGVFGGKKDQLLNKSRETLCHLHIDRIAPNILELCVYNKFMYACPVLGRSYGLTCTSVCYFYTVGINFETIVQ
jgi:hypothetical protein